MRTTVEIRDEQRARLLELAARKGEKGFSRLIQEALDLYLRHLDDREAETQTALETLGSLDQKEAARLRQSVGRLRDTWR